MRVEGGIGYSLEEKWCGQHCNYGVACQLYHMSNFTVLFKGIIWERWSSMGVKNKLLMPRHSWQLAAFFNVLFPS